MKQYFSYFKWLFIILGVMAVITGVVGIGHMAGSSYVRKNNEAPAQRVYDYADVLSDSEEEKLAELIAKREAQIGCDIVLVTIRESVLEKYGFSENTDANWEKAMMNYADDFYDENGYGFNKSFEGDGVLLLHNWYEGENGSEKGSWLSTSGRVYEHYTRSMINKVLDDVYYEAKDNPYRAYRLYIEDVYKEMSGKSSSVNLNPILLFAGSLIAAGVFIATHLKGKQGEKTTVASTYVENGSVRFNDQRDELVNKYVTSRVIPSNTGSGGGGGSHSGGAGGHISSSGASHGGGGRRG